MKESKKMGTNRTGVDVSPIHSKQMIEGAEKLTRPTTGSDQAVSENRIRFIKEADPVGSLPPPASVKGALKTGLKMIEGHDPKMLLDKLGERIAFERTGVRLYEALISKHEAGSEIGDLVPIDRLKHFKKEEHEHFKLLAETIKRLGADPTAVTPSADIIGVESVGILKVVTDARIGLADSLEAILVAELADNDSWKLLIQLTREAGLSDVEKDFQTALEQENEHLSSVRQWVEQIRLGKGEARRKIA